MVKLNKVHLHEQHCTGKVQSQTTIHCRSPSSSHSAWIVLNVTAALYSIMALYFSWRALFFICLVSFRKFKKAGFVYFKVHFILINQSFAVSTMVFLCFVFSIIIGSFSLDGFTFKDDS